MKILKLTGILFISILFFGFSSPSKKQSKNFCAPLLFASNQAPGSAKLYRITYYDINGSNTSTVVNLNSGQSVRIGYASSPNEISVLTKGGSFSQVVIEDAVGNILYSIPYSGPGLYNFYNVYIDCFTPSYIKLY